MKLILITFLLFSSLTIQAHDQLNEDSTPRKQTEFNTWENGLIKPTPKINRNAKLTKREKKLQLSLIEDIPNVDALLNLDDYVSAKELEATYANSIYGKFKLEQKKNTQADQLAKINEKKNICESLNKTASATCLNAILSEKTSFSAVEPINLYLVALRQADLFDRKKVIALAFSAGEFRVREDVLMLSLADVCSEIEC